VAAYDDVIAVASDSLPAYVHTGGALQLLRELLVKRGQLEAAAEAFPGAVAAQEEALARAPNASNAPAIKGAGLASLAGVERRCGDEETAVEHFKAALEAYDVALAVAPDMVDALAGKAKALEMAADLFSTTERRPVADGAAIRRDAILLSGRAVALAPAREDVRLVADRLRATETG
jgi:tetratricopeptide (TPR) repeat protein